MTCCSTIELLSTFAPFLKQSLLRLFITKKRANFYPQSPTAPDDTAVIDQLEFDALNISSSIKLKRREFEIPTYHLSKHYDIYHDEAFTMFGEISVEDEEGVVEEAVDASQIPGGLNRSQNECGPPTADLVDKEPTSTTEPAVVEEPSSTAVPVHNADAPNPEVPRSPFSPNNTETGISTIADDTSKMPLPEVPLTSVDGVV